MACAAAADEASILHPQRSTKDSALGDVSIKRQLIVEEQRKALT
jgi:hypothetical protein